MNTAHVRAGKVKKHNSFLRANLLLALGLPKHTKILTSISDVQALKINLFCGIKDSRVVYLQVPAWCLQQLN